MAGVDGSEEEHWLGGEAHVRSYHDRTGRSAVRQWLASGTLSFLVVGMAAAGAVYAGLGAAGMMKSEPEKRRRRTDERTVSASRERKGDMEEAREKLRQVRDEDAGAMGMATVLAAFGFGVLAGAAVTLLTTPESGQSIRRRLKRGGDAARRELVDVVEEGRESLNLVCEDAREAVLRTADRIKMAAKATKEAVAADDSPETPAR